MQFVSSTDPAATQRVPCIGGLVGVVRLDGLLAWISDSLTYPRHTATPKSKLKILLLFGLYKSILNFTVSCHSPSVVIAAFTLCFVFVSTTKSQNLNNRTPELKSQWDGPTHPTKNEHQKSTRCW